MTQRISEPVSVYLISDHSREKVTPRYIRWNGRDYKVSQVGLHHTYREGRTLYHVFSVTSDAIFLRLILNTDNLHWRLEEISDNLPD